MLPHIQDIQLVDRAVALCEKKRERQKRDSHSARGAHAEHSPAQRDPRIAQSGRKWHLDHPPSPAIVQSIGSASCTLRGVEAIQHQRPALLRILGETWVPGTERRCLNLEPFSDFSSHSFCVPCSTTAEVPLALTSNSVKLLVRSKQLYHTVCTVIVCKPEHLNCVKVPGLCQSVSLFTFYSPLLLPTYPHITYTIYLYPAPSS